MKKPMIYNIRFLLLIIIGIAFSSCENRVYYEGIVVDSANGSKLKDVKVLVIMNNTVQEHYGMTIPDSIPMRERDKLRKMNIGDSYSEHTYLADGYYYREVPIETDSLGGFSVLISEGCPFGCPDYEIRFEKEGYKSYLLEGDWHSREPLKIKMEQK